jgi:hypothetical protein
MLISHCEERSLRRSNLNVTKNITGIAHLHCTKRSAVQVSSGFPSHFVRGCIYRDAFLAMTIMFFLYFLCNLWFQFWILHFLSCFSCIAVYAPLAFFAPRFSGVSGFCEWGS